MDAMSIALRGLTTQTHRLATSAQAIASMGMGEAGGAGRAPVDLTKEIVDIIEIKTAYKAGLSVVRTQDALNGALLDILS